MVLRVAFTCFSCPKCRFACVACVCATTLQITPFFQNCMDRTTINSLGTAPLQPFRASNINVRLRFSNGLAHSANEECERALRPDVCVLVVRLSLPLLTVQNCSHWPTR